MRKFIIVSHAHFADGLKSSMEMIIGNNPNVYSICAYTDDSSDFVSEISELIGSFEENTEVLILTDLFGGSVNNEIFNHFDRKNIHLIAGVNLILAIQLVLGEPEKSIQEFINESVEQARRGIVYCNSLK